MEIINKIKSDLLNGNNSKLIIQSYALLLSSAMIMSLVSFIIAGYFGLVVSILMLIYICTITIRVPISKTLQACGARPLNYRHFARLYELQNALLRNTSINSIPQLYSIPSNTMNAFAIGSEDSSAIVFSEAMLNHLDIREIGGVMAHEIAHIENHDLVLMNISNTLWRFTHNLCNIAQVLVIVMLPLFLFGMIQMSLSSMLFLVFAPFLAALVHLALSRTREFEADRVASKLSGDPKGLAMALYKLESQKPTWWSLLFNYKNHYQQSELANYLRTHPPTKDRINKLLSYPSKQGLYWRVLKDGNYPKFHHNYETFGHPIRNLSQIFSRLLWTFGNLRRF